MKHPGLCGPQYPTVTQLLTYGQLGSKQRNHPTTHEWRWLLIHFCFLVCFHWWFGWLECVLIVSHIHELFICLILWSDIYCIILCDSAVLTHHFLFPMPTIFIGSGHFWGILRNNNCHREMIIHVFPGHISSSLMFVVLTGLTKAQYLIALLQCTCTLHWSAAQCSHTCTWLMAVPFHQLCFINTCAFSLWNYLSFLIISVAFIFI